MIDDAHLDTILEIDGGIAVGTARRAAAAGTRAFVAGNAVFAGGDKERTVYAQAIEAIRRDAAIGMGALV